MLKARPSCKFGVDETQTKGRDGYHEESGNSVSRVRCTPGNGRGRFARRERQGGIAGDHGHRGQGHSRVREERRPRVHVVFEEGTQSQWLHDLLIDHAERVIVCNVRGRSETTNKSDRIDADSMAPRRSSRTKSWCAATPRW